MKILATGASGFVGAAVARHLLRAGHEVRVLIRPTSDRRNLEGLAVEPTVGDLTDPDSLQRALKGCEALFHVAADYRLWAPNSGALYAANVDGTRNLMESALTTGIKRIVYTSSVATLGLNADSTPADEMTPSTLDDMIGHYKRSKFLAENVVRDMVRERQLPAVIVNPSTPIGPGDIKPTPTGRMIADAASGRMPAYVDTGLNIVHVDDVAIGHELAFARGRIGERYILGGENLSLKTILSQIAELTGRTPPRVCLPHNLVLALAYAVEGWARLTKMKSLIMTVDGVRMAKKCMYFSSDKAHRELGYQARPASEALRDAVAWFQNRFTDPACH